MTGGPLAPAVHLVKRFFGSIKPGPPASADEVWARRRLTAGERLIWDRMSNPDRRHAVGVARAVVAELGPDVERPVLAAALLHDSGKVVSQLRTPARVVATLVWAVAGERAAADLARRRVGGFARRLAQYRLHPRLGADLLLDAGSDPLTVAWTREHHLPPDRWTVPAPIADVLKACDDD